MRSLAAAAAVLVLASPLRAGAPVPLGPPGGGAEGEEKEPTPLVVSDSVDTLYLHDGTSVTGTVVASGLRGVVLVEQETRKERTILRADIERIERGPDPGVSASYPTGDEEGLIKVNPSEGEDDDGAPPDGGAAGSAPPGSPAPKVVTYDPAKIGKLVERLKKDPDAVKTAIVARLAAGGMEPKAVLFFAGLARSPVFENAAEDPSRAAADFMRRIRAGEVPESALRVLEEIGAADPASEARKLEALRRRAELKARLEKMMRARRAGELEE